MKEKTPSAFLLHHEFEGIFLRLNMEQRGALITAIFEYAVRGNEPKDLPDTVAMAFYIIKIALDKESAAYRERCRIAIENGKKGGRPRANTVSEKTDGFSENQQKHNNNNNNKYNNNNINNNINNNNYKGEDIGESEYAAFCFESVPPTDSAPLPDSVTGSVTSSAPCSADIQTEEEDLFALGVPRAYVEERRERAHAYARLHGGRVSDILLGWWREDQGKKKSYRRSAPISENKSYDLEEFFQAAVARSYESLAGT